MVLRQGETYDKKFPKATKAIYGGFAGMIASAIVHPLDLVKVRMQVFPGSSSTYHMASRIFYCEGCAALYNGLTASLMRQATSTTTRLGVYYWLFDEYKRTYNKKPNLGDKVAIGTIAGLAGALAGNPSEVALVRLLADTKRDPCNTRCGFRRRYFGLRDALYKTTLDGGFFALWRGGTLTMARSVCISVAQIGSYTKAHEKIAERKMAKDRKLLHVYTSIVSSFLTAILTLPVDLIKTKYQVQYTNQSQSEIFRQILKTKGVLHFWHGFIPYFIRLSIHTSLTYIILQAIT